MPQGEINLREGVEKIKRLKMVSLKTNGVGRPSVGKLMLWPVSKLRPYAKNARTHSEQQVDRIAASIGEFGFVNPILVDAKGGIIAGHARLLAAEKLGMEAVPVIQVTHFTVAQKRAYVLADNKLAEIAGWNYNILASELEALQAQSFDLDSIGFSEKEIERLLADAAQHVKDGAAKLDGLEYRVIVDCESETHQTELLVRFGKEGLPCRALIS